MDAVAALGKVVVRPCALSMLSTRSCTPNVECEWVQFIAQKPNELHHMPKLLLEANASAVQSFVYSFFLYSELLQVSLSHHENYEKPLS